MTTLSAGVSSLIYGVPTNPRRSLGFVRYSDSLGRDLVADPRDHLVQNVPQRRGGLEAEQLARLADVGHAHLHVVLVRRIVLQAERLVRSVDLAPDELGELAHRGRARGREVEILVEGPIRLHRQPDAD